MKIYILFPVLTILMSCSKLQKCYSGYVYDEESREPINRVFIKERFSKDFKSTYSNEKGYFKIDNDSESIGDLIFIRDGYKTDTIVTVWSQHGENLKYRFVRKESDTLYMQRIKR
jgi:hypothetical protein